MNNSKKLLALLMALAMLVTFAGPTFATGETPETVTLKFEYKGYEPTNSDVVLVNGEFISSQKNEDDVLTQAVVKKGYKKFEIKFMKVQGYDLSITISSISGSLELNSFTNFGRKTIGTSSLLFNPEEKYLKIGDFFGEINDDLTFKVEYKPAKIVDLIVVGGNEYTRNNILNKIKYEKNLGTPGKTYANEKIQITLPFVSRYNSIVKTYDGGILNRDYSSQSNTDSIRDIQINPKKDVIILVTYLEEGSTEQPLTFNFFNIQSGSIGLPGKDNYEFSVGENLDPNTFIANLTDKGMATGKFDKAIIDQVGFKYQISKNPVALKLEHDDKVILDAGVAESTQYPGFYDKDTEIKFTVAEQTDKIAKVYLTKAGVKDENPLAAEEDGSYKFNISVDTKIRVKYEDKESEPKAEDTANANAEVLNLASRNAGGDADWEELTKVKTLSLNDSGKILRLVDKNGKEVVSQRIQVNPEPPLDYPVTAKSNLKDKVITITPKANGVRNTANYQEDTDVTFTVPDHELVKTIKINGQEITKKTNSNEYTYTVTGDTVFDVVYYQSFKVDVEKVIDGAIDDNTSYGGVTFVGEQITKAQEDSTIKFSVKDIDGKRIKSVKVDGKEPAKDGDNYSFTIKKDTTITVEYVTQYQLKVNSDPDTGGITLVDDAEATLPKKFDKDTKVKFEVKDVTDKVIYSVKVGEDTLTAKDGVYEVTLDKDKTVELKYVDDPLLTAKEEAKAEIKKLENLSKEEKEAAEKAVTDAKDEAGVKAALEDARKLEEKNKAAKEAAETLKKAKEEADKAIDDLGNLDEEEKNAAKEEVKKANTPAEVEKALEDAKQKDAEIKAKKEAEEKLNAEKEALNKQIDELQDKAVKKALKDKVAHATTDNIDQVKAEVEDEIQKQKDKEKFDERKTELKDQIEQSDLDAETKKNLTDKVDALEDSSGLDDIRQEFANAKELKTAKDATKKEIEKLTDLTPEQKEAAEKAIDDAKDANEVDSAVKTAQDQNKENKEKKAAEEALNKAKDQAKKDIDALENLNGDEKNAAKDKVDAAKNTEEVKKALEAAQAQNKANADKKAVEDAKKAADEAQEAADEEKAKAEEAEKNAADAEKAAEDAQAEADAKAKEAEEAKKAAEEAKKASEENSDDADLKKAADEAAEKAEESQAAAETAKAAAEDAKAKADQAKADAEEAKDAADKAQEEADKAKADAEAKENALAPTAEEKDKAKKAIDDLDNLSPAEKNKFKDDVDKAQTKGEVEAAVEAARAKDEENKNKQPEPQPQPQPGGDDNTGDRPYNPPYYPGYYYDEPYVPHTRDYSKKDEYKPVERKEEKKEENKDTKGDILRVLYFYLDKGFYEMEVNGEIQQIPMDVQPMAINQRTMLPIRFVAEAIGATVEWHQDTQSATFTKDGITATITLGSNIIQVSDGRQIVLDAEPAVVDQRIFVPLTNISQIFGLTNGDLRDGNDNDIEWDQENYRVIIKVKAN